MHSDFSTSIDYSPCMHRHIIVDTSGGMHFSAGEVWDDIQERLLCLDCMEYVNQAEVHAAQTGIAVEINQTQTEVNHGNA